MKLAMRPDHQRLFAIASEQGGYFTAAQARACAFSWALLSHHAKRERFVRVRRGLYRLREYPASPREEVIAAWLAVGEAAVVSNESALDLLELSDVVPGTIHLTVPRSKRYRPAPPAVTIHTTTRPFRRGDVLVRNGVRVTSPLRSIIDAADSGTAPEQIVQAIRDALRRGMATESQLRSAARARGLRVERLVNGALDQRRSW